MRAVSAIVFAVRSKSQPIRGAVIGGAQRPQPLQGLARALREALEVAGRANAGDGRAERGQEAGEEVEERPQRVEAAGEPRLHSGPHCAA